MVLSMGLLIILDRSAKKEISRLGETLFRPGSVGTFCQGVDAVKTHAFLSGLDGT